MAIYAYAYGILVRRDARHTAMLQEFIELIHGVARRVPGRIEKPRAKDVQAVYETFPDQPVVYSSVHQLLRGWPEQPPEASSQLKW